MHTGIKVVIVVLAMGVGDFAAWAQGSANNPGQAQTDPMGKPAGDPTTNTLVPFGVNPPVPDSSTPQAADSARPPTTTEKIPVPQGNFTSGSASPAVSAPTNDKPAGQ
jgi:hypothetical protein